MSADTRKANGRVTVVMPTYNRAHLVPRAIESALAQTVAHLCDIVVVDDGSTDDTREAVARFGNQVRYVYRENGGLAAARNTGMCARLNEFVAFLDDDDEWEPDKTEVQLETMRRWPDVVLVAGMARIRYTDASTGWHRQPPVPFNVPIDFAPLLFEDNYLSVPMVLARRAAFDQVGLHDETLRRRQDYHMWTRLACAGPFVYLDRPVCTYAAALPDGLSDNRLAAMQANLHVRRLLKRELRRRPDCRAAWHRGMAHSLAILRDMNYRTGRYLDAARYGLQSMLHNPRGRPRWEWGRCAASLLRAATSPLSRA
jgi:glycosyltransferase involved in cell wall biosynthesis